MIRPLSGQVLVRVLPRVGSKTAGGIEIPAHTVSPEEQQEKNHHPEPPPPDICVVEAIGPWPKLANGMIQPPPFPPGATVLVREGTGTKLHRNIDEKLKLVQTEDVLAVLNET